MFLRLAGHVLAPRAYDCTPTVEPEHELLPGSPPGPKARLSVLHGGEKILKWVEFYFLE